MAKTISQKATTKLELTLKNYLLSFTPKTKYLTSCLLVLLFSSMGWGQSTANYAFSTNATGSLALDANGNSVDMSTGTTQLVGAASDFTASSVTNIGFDYYFMGNLYSKFTASADGILGLGSTAISGTAVSGGSVTTPRISALGADLYVSTSGKVHFKLVGSAPNRCLVVEWTGMAVTYSTTAANGNSTWQVRLYETTGIVEYVYGAINCTDTTYNPVSAGFSVNTTANNTASITFSNNSVSNGATFNTNTLVIGNVPNLNSTTNGSRRVYKFTPPTPAGPSNLTFASVTATATTLNWTAASPTTNIVRYVVLNSTNGGTSYNFVANVAVGSSTYAATGLTPNTSYTWKVVALSEGAESTVAATGTQTTTAGATYYWRGINGGTFATLTNWNTLADGTGTAPTALASTDVYIVDGAGTTAGGALTINLGAAASVGQFKVTSNTILTLASSSSTQRVITITGGSGYDFSIENGSSLLLTNTTNPISIIFTGTGNTGDISGILTVAGTSTTASLANSFLTTGGTGTVVTVSSTGVINNTATSNITSNGNVTGSAASLVFSSGSAYNVTGATTLAPWIPLATWDTASTITISGITTSTTAPTNNAQSFGNFVYNCPLATGSMSFFGTTTNAVIKGNLVITAAGSTGGTGIFRALTSGTLTVNGNVNVLQGRLQSANGTGIFNVLGNTTINTNGILDINGGTYNQRGATFTNDGTLTAVASTTRLAFAPLTSIAQTFAGSGTVLTNIGGLSLSNPSGLTITHTNQIITLRVNLFQGTITGSNKITFGTGLALACTTQIGSADLTTPGGNFDAAPTFNLGTGTYGVIYQEESVSRTTGFEIPSTRMVSNITNSNLNGVVLAGGNLSSAALTFSAGCGNITTTSSNVLTITGTATTAITRTSTTAYVNGPLELTLPASLPTSSTYLFPIGKTTLYPFELVNPTTNAGGTVVVRAEVFEANSGGSSGTNISAVNTDRYWAASITSGSGNFTNTQIKLTDASVVSTSAIASSATLAGAYDLVGGNLPTIVAGTSITSSTPAATSIPGFYLIGARAVSMSYVSSTTTQAVTSNIFTNAANNQIIGVQVVTTGNVNPLSMTSITFNTTGTTAAADITNAKVFYTGTSSTFATTTQFGSTKAAPSGSYDVTGSQALSEGTNYFWLTYDIPNTATVNNVVDAECTSISPGSAQTPTATAPAGSRTIKAQLNGDYLVGPSTSAPNYLTLTAAITDLNSLGVSGAVRFLLQSNYVSTTETFPLTINAFNGASAINTVTIQPNTGVTASISGSVASGALIVLNGADYVTFDGSSSGGSDRSLTITNTATTAPTAIALRSLGAGAGATNNTIKNCNISTGIQTSTGYGISVGGSTPGTTGADNDNTTIQNNAISACVVGIFAQGTATISAGGNDNLNVTGNTIIYNSNLGSNLGINVNNSLSSNISSNNVTIATITTSGTTIGMKLAGSTGATVSQNTVSVSTTSNTTPVAISLETNFINSTVTRNIVTQSLATNTGGYGGRGITIGTGTASSGLTVSNNFITGVNGTNWESFGNSSSAGILIGVIGVSSTLTTTTGGINLWNNSVNMTGSMGTASTTALTTALYIGSGASALDIRNNIFANTQTGTSATQKNYAIYSAAANTAFSNINYNDYFVSNSFNAASATAGFLTSDRTGLAGIVTGFGANANSINVAPVFVSATDLHLNTSSNCQLDNKGVVIATVTTDIDGVTRSNSTPDMGADEFTGTLVATTWTGTTNNLWSEASNWSCGAVPTVTDAISIASGTPTLDIDFSLGASGTLTLSGSGTLSVASDKVLTIAGTANFGGKVVTFKSDATGTAMFGPLTGTLTNATNVKVERFIPSGKRAFRLLSPAVTTTTFISGNWQQQTHITGGLGTTGLGFDVTETNNPSMYTYNNLVASGTGWTAIANTNATNLITGVGYRVLIRGDRNVNLTVASQDDMNAATTLSATGTLKTGEVVLSSSTTPAINNTSNTTTNGFSLVGNPYQSAVDWHLVSKAGIEDTYYAWAPNLGSGAARGNYVAYNVSTGNSGGGSVGQYIQPGQAFFVKNTLGAEATLTFQEAHKATTSANVFRTANETQSSNLASLSILLYDPNELAIGGYPIDATKAVFGSDYSNELGLGDATKLEAASENIAWFRNNTKLAIDAAAPVTTSDELVMKTLRLGANKNYTFKIQTTNFDTALIPYLVDNFLNTQTEISTSQAYLASFATTSNVASYSENRFKVVFQNALLNTDTFATKVGLYPNPSKGNGFYIQLPSTSQAIVKLYNTIGQEIAINNNEGYYQANQSLATGVYHIMVTQGEKTSKLKWIVE
jgi:hypothetical protein